LSEPAANNEDAEMLAMTGGGSLTVKVLAFDVSPFTFTVTE